MPVTICSTGHASSAQQDMCLILLGVAICPVAKTQFSMEKIAYAQVVIILFRENVANVGMASLMTQAIKLACPNAKSIKFGKSAAVSVLPVLTKSKEPVKSASKGKCMIKTFRFAEPTANMVKFGLPTNANATLEAT